MGVSGFEPLNLLIKSQLLRFPRAQHPIKYYKILINIMNKFSNFLILYNANQHEYKKNYFYK